MTRLGKEIRKARIDREWNLAQLEDATGVTFRHLSAIERGEIDPRWSTVLKLARALDLNLDVVALETQREELLAHGQ
jgi:transcriptional regulator with XRE-family HTH domain